MACQTITMLGAVFALWGEPELEDVDRIREAVEAAYAACGHPIIYVTRVPPDAPAPSAEFRARLDREMPELLKLCSTYHAVLEGEGFAAAMKRGVLTGMLQLSWRRKTFFVHAKTSEVAGSVPLDQRAVVARLLETAKVRGLLEPAPPERIGATG